MTKLFGTDGVRGIANKELTGETAFLLGKYGSVVLAGETAHKPKILVGTDTRISCPMLESALIAGICSAGADACVCGVIPTPGIAKLVQDYNCDAGVVISASHNSYEFNGIKFFSGEGFKLPDRIENMIEDLIENINNDDREWPTGKDIGHRYLFENASKDYVNSLKKAIPVDLSGIKIALDCANGATAHIATLLFEDLNAQVVAIGNKPDGLNINKGCGSTHIHALTETVVNEKCDLGVAFDGDGDRMLAVDSEGNFIDGDIIMAIIALHMKNNNQLKDDTLVVTVMSNLGLDIFASANGIKLAKTKVGDRYVIEEMVDKGYILGGEQSGHIILLENSTTGDGLLSALKLLEVITTTKKSLSELSKVMHVLPQVLKGIKVKNEHKSAALEDTEVKATCNRIEKTLGQKGRILVRASGTEPLIRVMLEGEDIEQITCMCDEIIEIIKVKYAS